MEEVGGFVEEGGGGLGLGVDAGGVAGELVGVVLG